MSEPNLHGLLPCCLRFAPTSHPVNGKTRWFARFQEILPSTTWRSHTVLGQLHSLGQKARSTGEGTSTTCPVGVRPPVPRSILKTTTLFDNWFSASRYWPLGSMAKFLGSFPPVKTCATKVSVPFLASTAKIAMLSCTRLDAS